MRNPPNLLHDLISSSAELTPDAPACAFGEQQFTYQQLQDNVARFASGLAAAGCHWSERVAVYLPKLPETVATIFGASRAGCIAVPVNPLLKAPQVSHILEDSQASILVTSYSRFSSLANTLIETKACQRYLKKIVLIDNAPESRGLPTQLFQEFVTTDHTPTASTRRRRLENDLVAILYTSGSTGRPKGVVLSHHNMVVGAISVADYLNNSSQDRILSVLPLSFDAGLSQLTTAFHTGAKVVLLDYLLPRDVVRACAREKITGITGVPPLWMQLATLEWPAEAAESVRYFANTGGKMPKDTLTKLRRHFPAAEPFLMYGLTEAFRSTYLPPDQVDQRPDSIGMAIPNAEILVITENGEEAEPNQPGELVHRGPLVAQGYWNDIERTRERFRPLPNVQAELPNKELAVWSGDTVVKDEDGYLYFVGRKDDMIKTSGYRVSPTEVEEAAFASGAVREVAAIATEHPALGQAIVLVAAALGDHAQDGTAALNESAEKTLLAHLRTDLPAFMIPQKILWRTELPKNPNGKIDRPLLRTECADLFSGEPT